MCLKAKNCMTFYVYESAQSAQTLWEFVGLESVSAGTSLKQTSYQTEALILIAGMLEG